MIEVPRAAPFGFVLDLRYDDGKINNWRCPICPCTVCHGEAAARRHWQEEHYRHQLVIEGAGL